MCIGLFVQGWTGVKTELSHEYPQPNLSSQADAQERALMLKYPDAVLIGLQRAW